MVTKRIKIVFSNEEINRLTIKEKDTSAILVTVNVHGMKCAQAKRFINNIINTIHTAFQLIVIHGYNHGTAIKDMLAKNFCNNHICNQYADQHNKGITHILIA